MDKAQVELTRIVEKMDLKNLTPEIPIDDVVVTAPDISRPALRLTGFFEKFDADRLHVLGLQEEAYIETLSEERKEYIFDELLSRKVPAVIFTRSIMPGEIFLEKALKYQVPVFSSDKYTSNLTAELIRWLNVQLAPRTSIHGVLSNT